jgi:cyclopropane-fatty-acyl-phospholipid synthase
MDLICKKVNIRQSDRVLDIGCGWGGLAGYMAERHGCNVTAVNIAGEQLSYARSFCRNLPVNVVACDYRDIKGKFDKIISVGMFEHVGLKNYPSFMKQFIAV